MSDFLNNGHAAFQYTILEKPCHILCLCSIVTLVLKNNPQGLIHGYVNGAEPYINVTQPWTLSYLLSL